MVFKKRIEERGYPYKNWSLLLNAATVYMDEQLLKKRYKHCFHLCKTKIQKLLISSMICSVCSSNDFFFSISKRGGSNVLAGELASAKPVGSSADKAVSTAKDDEFPRTLEEVCKKFHGI